MRSVADTKATSTRCGAVDMETPCELKGDKFLPLLGTESRVEPAHRRLPQACRMGIVASQPNRKRRDGLIPA